MILFWGLCALGLDAALTYFVFLRRPPSLMRALIKTAFMAALALAFATATFLPAEAKLLAFGMGFSAIGDYLLAREGRAALGLGIAAFLAAQLIYAFLFFSLWPEAPDLPRLIAMGAVVLLALGFLAWLGPSLGWLALGVIPYAAAIASMVIGAIGLPAAGWPAMLGAALFLFSDGVLSAELFKLPADAPARRWTAPAVWASYAGAQMLIAWGVVEAARAVA